jgi:hypothetical protein
VEELNLKISAGYDTAVNILCEVIYNDTCVVTILYEYQTTDDQIALKVMLVTELICLPALNVIPYILYAAGGVILIGILTLILWKLFTLTIDRREFLRFEKERAAAKWAKVYIVLLYTSYFEKITWNYN